MVTHSDDPLRFQILHDRVAREQEFFWQRFMAFSALHAGLFVLAASNSVIRPRLVTWAGLLLSIAWASVQVLSLHYVDRDKAAYYDLCDKHKLKPQPHPYLPRWLSSTKIATAVSFITLAVWLMECMRRAMSAVA